MANEIKLDYLPSKTVYVAVQNMVGQFYNGATFENFNAANWATYVLAAAEIVAGAGFYKRDFPATGTPAGRYVVTALQQLGASPAVSDLHFGANTLDWTGATEMSFPTPALRYGVAQGGGASTITLDAGAAGQSNFYIDELLMIIAGLGAGQSRYITGYDGSTKIATLNKAWIVNPDNTSVFEIAGQAVDNFDIVGIRAVTDALGAAISANLAATNAVGVLATAVKAKTDNLPATPANEVTGAAIAAALAAGVTLNPSQDIYIADLQYTRDSLGVRDEYTVLLTKNGAEIASGVTVPVITVQKRDGTDLVAAKPLTQIAGGLFAYNAVGAERAAAGDAVIVRVTATVAATPRVFVVRSFSRDV